MNRLVPSSNYEGGKGSSYDWDGKRKKSWGGGGGLMNERSRVPVITVCARAALRRRAFGFIMSSHSRGFRYLA